MKPVTLLIGLLCLTMAACAEEPPAKPKPRPLSDMNRPINSYAK